MEFTLLLTNKMRRTKKNQYSNRKKIKTEREQICIFPNEKSTQNTPLDFFSFLLF